MIEARGTRDVCVTRHRSQKENAIRAMTVTLSKVRVTSESEFYGGQIERDSVKSRVRVSRTQELRE